MCIYMESRKMVLMNLIFLKRRRGRWKRKSQLCSVRSQTSQTLKTEEGATSQGMLVASRRY